MDSFQPGDFVVLDTMPEWGLGQVQSHIGNKITVNFENGGKQVLHSDLVSLTPVYHIDEKPHHKA